MSKKKIIKGFVLPALTGALLSGATFVPGSVFAADADTYVDISALTFTQNGTTEAIKNYTSDDYDEFLNDYNAGTLPDVYITGFVFDGVGKVSRVSYDETTAAVSESVIETTALNINTTGDVEFSGSATDTFIAVNTNGVTSDINLILNNVNLTSGSKTPAIMVYNKDEGWSDAKVTIKTLSGTNNYLSGGKLKKVSAMASDNADSYTSISSVYAEDSRTDYYYRYKSDEVSKLLFAIDTADQEKIAKGDPYLYYKFSGAVGTDTDIYFEGDGYLEIASQSDEGIEAKGDIVFTGGTGDYKITAYDDGINASTSGTDISINVNTMYVSVNEDADEGDAIDSNGTLHIEGGTVFALAHPTSQDAGVDSDNGTYINGGTLIATGNMADEIQNSSKQNFMMLNFASRQDAGTLVAVTDIDNNPVWAYESERPFTILTYSSPDLAEGTYYVYKDGSVSGSAINGLYTDITDYTPGTQQQWSGSGNAGPGGAQPGDGQQPPDMNGENGGQPGDGQTPPDKPDGENGGQPGDGQQPPDMNGENGGQPGDGQQPPDMNSENGGQAQASGEYSVEFVLSSTSHTFNNVSDYTESEATEPTTDPTTEPATEPTTEPTPEADQPSAETQAPDQTQESAEQQTQLVKVAKTKAGSADSAVVTKATETGDKNRNIAWIITAAGSAAAIAATAIVFRRKTN